MNELEMLNYIRDFKVVVTESVKENICEILNLNKTNEKNLDVSINVRGDIEVRSFGYKFFSVSKDIDDYTKCNSKFYYRPLRITENTTEQEIKKYNNFLKFVIKMQNKINYKAIQEMVTSNFVSMENEIDTIIQDADY